MITAIVLAVILVFTIGSRMVGFLLGGNSHFQEVTLERHQSSDKIAVIPVEGIITGSSRDGSGYSMVELIEDQLKLAAKDEHVKAVLLKVNSPGGEVLASDDIYNAIIKFQNEHNKPVELTFSSTAFTCSSLAASLSWSSISSTML